MPDVRYVCLSDLHFGAENSILTGLDAETRVDHTKPSLALEGLLRCLRHVADHNEGSEKPTLILAGDIFELALARDNDAAMVFEMFLQQALGPDGVFDDTVYYIPGNHDHHLWEGARERQYSQYVRERSGPLEPPWHTTRMRATLPEWKVCSEFVTSLIDRALGHDSAVTFRVVYPNLALDAPASTATCSSITANSSRRCTRSCRLRRTWCFPISSHHPGPKRRCGTGRPRTSRGSTSSGRRWDAREPSAGTSASFMRRCKASMRCIP